MKKLAVVLLAMAFITLNSGVVRAEWFAKADPEKAPAATPPTVKKPAAAAKVNNKAQEMITKKKTELNGTQWTINVKPMSGKGKAETDVLSFSDSKISSKNMEARGFVATNYSMRILEDNETYTWETMQVSEKDGTAFWRGDIGADGVMRGVVSVRNKKNAVSDYNFYSLESKKMDMEQEKTPVEPAALSATPVAAPVTGMVQEQN